MVIQTMLDPSEKSSLSSRFPCTYIAFTLTPYLTPGHSPGHVVYHHAEDGVLMAGDLFTSKRGRLHRPMPMFTADMTQAVESSEIVRTLTPKRLEVCHGDPVFQPAAHLDAYIQRTAPARKLNR